MTNWLQDINCDIRVLNYRYDEPDIAPDEKNSRYDSTYDFIFESPYKKFIVAINIFLLLKGKEDFCYSEISTLTDFRLSKEVSVKMGLLTDDGDLSKDTSNLINPITDLVEKAFISTQDAITARQINTICEGKDLFKIDRYTLYTGIEKLIKRNTTFFSS